MTCLIIKGTLSTQLLFSYICIKFLNKMNGQTSCYSTTKYLKTEGVVGIVFIVYKIKWNHGQTFIGERIQATTGIYIRIGFVRCNDCLALLVTCIDIVVS